MLADSLSAYTWGRKLYTGKEGDTVERNLLSSVMMELLDDNQLRHKGYIVYTDNFYFSPALFKSLLEEGFGACGTVHQNRKGIPVTIRSTALRKGEVHSTQDGSVLVLKWKDE